MRVEKQIMYYENYNSISFDCINMKFHMKLR